MQVLRSPESRARARRRRCEYHANIDIGLPLGTVVITLLVIVMVTAPPYIQGFPLHLPVSKHAVSRVGATREDAMPVNVTRDGAIYFRHTAVQPQDLRNKIQEAMGKGAEKKIYMQVAKCTFYADVSTALDAIRDSGVANVIFLTEKQEP
jgi:biopolymer transport protein ExbD